MIACFVEQIQVNCNADKTMSTHNLQYSSQTIVIQRQNSYHEKITFNHNRCYPINRVIVQKGNKQVNDSNKGLHRNLFTNRGKRL